jgi:hypothetical protein
MLKLCKKCMVEKPIDEFYRHPSMADGHLSKCKECAKADVIENRNANLEYYRQYDRKRYDAGGRPTSSATPERRSRYNAKWIERNPEARACHWKVGNAVRDGRIIRPTKCSSCGKKKRVEAHHADYSKPFDIEWLCKKCHGKTWAKDRITIEPRERGGHKPPMQPTRARPTEMTQQKGTHGQDRITQAR